jgi:hypothetical protein
MTPPQTLPGESAEPRGWAGGPAIVAYLAATLFLVHVAFARNYGYFVDELYHLACAEHLAWGYVDQPSLIAVIGQITRSCSATRCRRFASFPRWPPPAKCCSQA